MPTLHVVAGPNGCDTFSLTRTTYFRRTVVVDPDAIAGDTMAGSPVWVAREVLFYDNTDTARPHCEASILREGAWWTAELLPTCGSAATARVTAKDD